MFVDRTMKDRDGRLKTSRQNAERCQRELLRDRADLERREKQMLKTMASLAQKGDLNKARMMAQQIARYRQISDSNFRSSVGIATRAQTMLSNHRINKAEVEAVKGVGFANNAQTTKSVYKKQMKIARANYEYEMMESIMNEGLDDVYDAVEDNYETDETFQDQVDSILREALGNSPKKEVQKPRPVQTQPRRTGGAIVVHFRKYIGMNDSNRTLTDSGCDGASLTISNLEMSVDMLKRELIKDPYAIGQLGLQVSKDNPAYDAFLGSTKAFTIGKITEDGDFQAFNFTAGLKSVGIKNNETVWVLVKEVAGEGRK